MAASTMTFDDWMALQALYADYAMALDQGELHRWPAFFSESCSYRLQSRENFERGLPLCTLAFESRAMLIDRVHGVVDTIYHDPYWQRHVVGAPRILSVDAEGFRSEASYVVIRTQRDALPEILSTGRYVDRVVRTPEGLRFAERHCIFDNDLIPNSIIAPI